jgi:hypothetical protein
MFRNALCKRFNVTSIAQLGIGDTLEAASWWTYMTLDEWTEEVDRRRLLELTAHGTTALLLPVPTLTAAAQLLEGRRRISPGDLATPARVATDIANAYLATPGADVRHAAKAHAYTLLGLLKHAQMSGDTRTRLEAMASDAACLAGHGQLQAGQLDKADAWFTEALRLARQAGDRRLEALALTSSAWIPLHRPDPDSSAAVKALEAAAGFQRFLSPAGRAWVFAFLAEQNAVLGDDLVSGRFLEHAHTAIAFVPHEEPGWGWWSTHGQLGGWDGVRPQIFTGTRSLYLGRPAEALERYDDALDGITLPVRRCDLQRHVMKAYVGLGDPDRACVSGIAVLDEAKECGLGAWPQKIAKVRLTFPKPWATLRSVIEFDERLRLALWPGFVTHA